MKTKAYKPMKLAKSSEEFSSPRKIKTWKKLEDLLDDLEGRDLDPAVQKLLEERISSLNESNESEAILIKDARSAYHAILKCLEKEMNLVAKNHHRMQWLALGMTVFGIPIGLALSTSIQNLSFIGVGLPIGLAVGIGIGNSLDVKAKNENRQLNIEL